MGFRIFQRYKICNYLWHSLWTEAGLNLEQFLGGFTPKSLARFLGMYLGVWTM